MDVTQLLAFAVKNKASDLHLSAGLPPMIASTSGRPAVGSSQRTASTRLATLSTRDCRAADARSRAATAGSRGAKPGAGRPRR